MARTLRMARRNGGRLQGRGSGHFRDRHQGNLSMFHFFPCRPPITSAPAISCSWRLLVWALIFLALVFDFLNGLHDAANSIATVVSTRVLSPRTGGRLGRVFQLRRLRYFSSQSRRHHSEGHRRSTSGPRSGHGQSFDRRHVAGVMRLEYLHLVPGPAHQFLPCPHWRHGRGRSGNYR